MRYQDYSLVNTVLADIEAGRPRSHTEIVEARNALERMIRDERQLDHQWANLDRPRPVEMPAYRTYYVPPGELVDDRPPGDPTGVAGPPRIPPIREVPVSERVAALIEQADEVRSALETLLQANQADQDPGEGRDNRRLIRMCIQRLERGLRGERGTDFLRTATDWIGEP